jgi:hypothetical protein
MMNRSLTLSLAVCLFALVASSVHAAEASVQSLSTDAAEALANAESNVNMAKKRSALWTTAVGALEKAREAAKKGDSASVISQSETASQQAFLGMAQLGYPSTEQ